MTVELKFELKCVQISTGQGDCASWVSNAVDRCQGTRFIGCLVQGFDIDDPPIEIEIWRARTYCSLLACSVQTNLRGAWLCCQTLPANHREPFPNVFPKDLQQIRLRQRTLDIQFSRASARPSCPLFFAGELERPARQSRSRHLPQEQSMIATSDVASSRSSPRELPGRLW